MSSKDSKQLVNRVLHRNGTGKIRLGIIGCGAITESHHLRAVLTSSSVELTALSDMNTSRLGYIVRQFGLGSIGVSDYRETFPLVDAVILAVPNALHARIGCEFLSRGIHVLCEKPLAVSSSECDQLCQSARAGSCVLAVGFVTRFFPSVQLMKSLITSEFLGPLRSFDFEWGTAEGWVTVSGYNLAKTTSGGGVVMVSGSHFIDRMLYLFDHVDVISYSDDSRGGPEANCVATFRLNASGQTLSGYFRLSGTHKLANRLRLIGEKGILELPEGETESVTYFPAHGDLRHEISCSGNSPLDENYFRKQLDDFARSIQTGGTPMVDGVHGSKSVRLIERCYELATRIDEPWCDATLGRLVPRIRTTSQACCDD
jgi:predicted dehydrogenase